MLVYDPLLRRRRDCLRKQLQVCRIPPRLRDSSEAIHHTSVWTVRIPTHDDANGLLLVKWLEEVLFMDEVEQKWLVNCSFKIEEHENIPASTCTLGAFR